MPLLFCYAKSKSVDPIYNVLWHIKAPFLLFFLRHSINYNYGGDCKNL